MNPFESNFWFKTLSAHDADALLSAGKTVRLKRGEVLFHNGDSFMHPSGSFFGVRAGRLKASAIHEVGKEFILMVVEPGNWIGETSLVGRKPRFYDMTALTDVELIAVHHSDFERLCLSPSFAMAIASLLESRLRLLYSAVENMILQSPRIKVTRLIKSLAKSSHQPDTQHANIGISQEVLATMLGISRQTVNKEVQRLVKLGYISVSYGQIIIENYNALNDA